MINIPNECAGKYPVSIRLKIDMYPGGVHGPKRKSSVHVETEIFRPSKFSITGTKLWFSLPKFNSRDRELPLFEPRKFGVRYDLRISPRNRAFFLCVYLGIRRFLRYLLGHYPCSRLKTTSCPGAATRGSSPVTTCTTTFS